MLTLSIAAAIRKLVSLSPVHAPQVGEEQQPVVSGGDKEVIHHVVRAQCCATNTLAATALRTVLVRTRALGIAPARDRDHNLFFCNEIFNVH